MEKTASVEERIRRAEEIYQRRRSQGVRVYSNSASAMRNSPSISLFKKMIIKIIICIIIYSSFYLIKNSNYFFSQDVINKTSQILSYDMNLQGMFNDIKKYFDYIHIFERVFLKNLRNITIIAIACRSMYRSYLKYIISIYYFITHIYIFQSIESSSLKDNIFLIGFDNN